MAVRKVRWVCAWVLIAVVGSAEAFGQSPPKVAPTEAAIRVDPALISQLDQVWKVIGQPKNPVWPGWDATDTPVLIYFPGRQELLLNHPKPPEGFKRYSGPVKSALGPIYLRDGQTMTALDGQNTAVDVGGVRTLMVADTLSTRRQWAESVVASAKGDPAGVKARIDGGLDPNPYPAFGLFAHEAFHVYQHRRAPKKVPNELALADYPSLSVENNVGFALEAEFLKAALEAKTKEDATGFLKKWWAARSMRRAKLPPALVEYEDAGEFNEGTAKYVEYRLSQHLESVEPLDQLWLIQGFNGFKDLSGQRASMRTQMLRMMSGQMNVNNDPYGASPVRFRLYFSGMAIAAALDLLESKWHDRIFEPAATLAGLLSAELNMKPEELDAEIKRLRSGERFTELVRQKAQLEEDGKAHVVATVKEFDQAEGDLVIDYAGLTKPQTQFTFTPFGILRVADGQTIYRLIPINGKVGAFGFAEDSARPVFHDTKAKRIRLRLTGKPDAADLAKQFGAAPAPDRRVELPKFTLPGVTLEGVKGTVQLDGKRVTVVLAE